MIRTRRYQSKPLPQWKGI